MEIVSFIQHFVFVNFNQENGKLPVTFKWEMKLFASYPDVSLFRWKFARKERREGEKGRPPLLFLLPMVHCDSSPVTGVSRSPLCGKIRSTWDEGDLGPSSDLVLNRRDKNQYVVAELYPWSKFYFLLFTKSYNIPPPPPPPPTDKKRFEERKFQPKIKLNSKKYICQLPFCRSYMSFLEYYAEKKGESDWWTISKKRFRKSFTSLTREWEKFSSIASWCMLFF